MIEGPGINDNGSGSAAQLEVALQMAELGIEPVNQVRFIWFGAEEAGLVGSAYYVSQLTKRELKDIAVMLNFDMVGSPNAGWFVYDGDASDTASTGSTGSGVVEDVFVDFFESIGRETKPTAFDGRSDYDAFVAAGIPAGGLFTGAEDIKTAEQAANGAAPLGSRSTRATTRPATRSTTSISCAGRDDRRPRARGPDTRYAEGEGQPKPRPDHQQQGPVVVAIRGGVGEGGPPRCTPRGPRRRQ